MKEFIATCVLLGTKFPALQPGRAPYSISDLAEMDVKSLGIYIDNLEKTKTLSRADIAQGKSEKYVANHPLSEVVTHLNSIFEYKIAAQKAEKKKARLQEIDKLLEEAKTPEERKADLLREKESLIA